MFILFFISFLFICLIKWRKISYSYISCDFSHQLWKVQLAWRLKRVKLICLKWNLQATVKQYVMLFFFLLIVLILSNDNKRTFIVFSHEVIYFLFICLIKWRKISYSYISCDFSHQLWKVQVAWRLKRVTLICLKWNLQATVKQYETQL